ncbi:hypothetical protein GCM10009557_49570 [Virgisporangium ochraceum]|uniref:Uncharacterized protein n=1 Tax=Virgisporangium ochraceum TaxID=65505 RepID=A0A8J3ZW90_9ACTN|nr:hypothetical protein Voc01_064410 [Virgisporangium ochraceum]
MVVTVVMVAVAVILVGPAVMAGILLDRRRDGLTRAERDRWRSVTRGRTAARRRRDEAALVAGLTGRVMSRAEYRREMSDLAAADATRCPVHVPRLGKR